MDVEWKVRRAELADVPAIVALSDALFREDSGQRDPLMNHDWAQQHGQQYFKVLLDNRAYLVLIAEEHGEVVGYLAGSTSEAGELRTVRSAELESMCVAPASRDRRAGEALAQAFLQWARAQGAAWVTVTAYAANRGALSFYEWQVLLHVVNHGTDHRAQLLRSLHDLGLETSSQDYIFYVYDHP